MENTEWDYKVEYAELAKQYALPSLDDLERDFDAEKVLDKETKFLLREVRRCISDKLSSCMTLFETLINPSATPLFVMSALKKLSSQEIAQIREIYKVLAKLSLRINKLESFYDEQQEASFISEVSKLWQTLGKDIHDIFQALEEKSDADLTISLDPVERNYFN